ncbi:MAG: hypothetical protein JWP04_3702, partial [Belnapia sp.]|nr:hypothetical protein [Belnapia sp.]
MWRWLWRLGALAAAATWLLGAPRPRLGPAAAVQAT